MNPLREAIFEAAEDEGRKYSQGLDDGPALPNPLAGPLPMGPGMAAASGLGLPTPPVMQPTRPRKPSLKARLAQANPYNVMLAVSATALGLGALFLFFDLLKHWLS
jgi:hypothetical protein